MKADYTFMATFLEIFQRKGYCEKVFSLFRRITEYTINLGEAVKRDVANMTDELWDILGLMGKECENYYV
jgi:hypothetical protein